MTDFSVRHFDSDEAVARVGEGLLSRTLPRSDWTHEAHLAATTYLLLKHPEVDLDSELPELIRGYNESVGGVNNDSEGYRKRDWPLRFWSRERLFSVEARRGFVLPDLAAMPYVETGCSFV